MIWGEWAWRYSTIIFFPFFFPHPLPVFLKKLKSATIGQILCESTPVFVYSGSGVPFECLACFVQLCLRSTAGRGQDGACNTFYFVLLRAFLREHLPPPPPPPLSCHVSNSNCQFPAPVPIPSPGTPGPARSRNPRHVRSAGTNQRPAVKKRKSRRMRGGERSIRDFLVAAEIAGLGRERGGVAAAVGGPGGGTRRLDSRLIRSADN